MLIRYYRLFRLRSRRWVFKSKRVLFSALWRASSWVAQRSALFFYNNGLPLPGVEDYGEDRYTSVIVESRY